MMNTDALDELVNGNKWGISTIGGVDIPIFYSKIVGFREQAFFELAALKTRLTELEAENLRLQKAANKVRNIIERCEYFWDECPICGNESRYNHYDDCELGIWLAANPKEEEQK